MASRFIDTEIWSEDWFCELGVEHQLFWVYLTCQCNNAGIWKPNKIDFEIKSRTRINMDAFLNKVNERGCNERIIITETGRWFLTGFIAYQWFNKNESFDLTLSNKLHTHIYNLLVKDKISIEKVRGLREVLETPRDKDKDNNTLSVNTCLSKNKKGNENSEKPDLGKSNLFRQPVIPTKNQVWEVFYRSGGSKEMAKSFFEKYEATGWFLNGSPITNFAPLAQKFISNWISNDKGRSPNLPTYENGQTKLVL